MFLLLSQECGLYISADGGFLLPSVLGSWFWEGPSGGLDMLNIPGWFAAVSAELIAYQFLMSPKCSLFWFFFPVCVSSSV